MKATPTQWIARAAALLWLGSWLLPVLDDAVPHVLSAATNGAFIILVAHVELNRISRPGLFLRVAIACLILNLYWLVQLVRDGSADELRAGYYAWLAAFALLVVSGVSIHRTSRTPRAGTPA